MGQTILVVEDDAALAEALSDTLELAGYNTVVTKDGKDAIPALNEHDPALVLSDVHMEGLGGHELLRYIKGKRPELPVLLMTAYGSVQKAVEAMRDGAADYLLKPFDATVLVEKVQQYTAVYINDDSEPVAEDIRSKDVLVMARRVAGTDATVMISGESGTGKEVVARYIHRHSVRSNKPFIAINCAAIPDNMLEATLFGYEKGAFTGAYKSTPGKFEQAQGGTLLLDEVSEMEHSLQAKLLRVLQEREVERLGSNKLISLDVRVLATTNRDMRMEINEGRFREDLYYRLNVFPINLPSLRDRRDDISPLIEHSLSQAAGKLNQQVPEISKSAMEELCIYDWPGNVRELDNMMQRALILKTGSCIQLKDLSLESDVDMVTSVVRVDTDEQESLGDGLKMQEYKLITEALKSGSRKAAAEKLGISPRTLRYKLARMRDEGVLPSSMAGT